MMVCHLNGPFTTAEQVLRSAPLVVRRQKVVELIQWLLASNCLYSNVSVNSTTIEALPASGTLPGSVIQTDAMPTDSPPTQADEAPPDPVSLGCGIVTAAFDERLDADRLTDAAQAFFEDDDQSTPMSAPGSAAGSTPAPADETTQSPITAGAGAASASGGAAPTTSASASNKINYRSGRYAQMFDKKNWGQAFVRLFPHGRGTPGEAALAGVSLHAYIQHVLSLAHGEFARDHAFVLCAFDVLRGSNGVIPATIRASALADAVTNITEHELRAGIALAQRKANGETVDMNVLPVHVRNFMSILSTGRRQMHGTDEEGASARGQLYALRRFLGASPIWLTFSPNDQRILTSLLYCGFTPQEIADLTPREHEVFVAGNPVASAACFHATFEALVKHIFRFDKTRCAPAAGQDGAFGAVTAYFMAVEEQYRGALHGHVLLWVAGLPTTLVDVLNAVQGDLVDDIDFRSTDPLKSAGLNTSRTGLNPLAPTPLVRYMATTCLQTNYLPLSRIKCPSCGNADIDRVPIPDSVAQAGGPLSDKTPQPILYKCACGAGVTESQLVDAWLLDVHPSGGAPVDDHVFGTADVSSPPVTSIDGIDDEDWAIGLGEKDLARLAHRCAEFQSTSRAFTVPSRSLHFVFNLWPLAIFTSCTLGSQSLSHWLHPCRPLQEHLHTHTKSCFKNGKRSCRYGFPADTQCDAHVKVVWTTEGALLPVAERRVEHIDRLNFVPARAESAPYTNRHNPTILMALPSNGDFAVVASSPGITHYITSYSTKSQVCILAFPIFEHLGFIHVTNAWCPY
jgi:hypothetical protein